jgi:hypothetical protein
MHPAGFQKAVAIFEAPLLPDGQTEVITFDASDLRYCFQ